eukprot:CCRYP_012094-RA/>CCRYP_012094-RA protein AED:0.44 eAED:0.78 QI:0/0/0/1/0/0/2/0/62
MTSTWTSNPLTILNNVSQLPLKPYTPCLAPLTSSNAKTPFNKLEDIVIGPLNRVLGHIVDTR